MHPERVADSDNACVTAFDGSLAAFCDVGIAKDTDISKKGKHSLTPQCCLLSLMMMRVNNQLLFSWTFMVEQIQLMKFC